MTLESRPLAGSGVPGTALDVLERVGWIVTSDERANVYAFPPDRHVVVAFLPEANDFAAHDELWVIRAYGDLHDLRWQATFTDDTPAEFVAAFLTDLVKPEPLDTERDDEPPSPGRGEAD